jgi:uncharacterized delta-60 repeat protein
MKHLVKFSLGFCAAVAAFTQPAAAARGDLDLGFNPPYVNGSRINKLALQADGGILIAGSFSEVGVDSIARSGLARLNRDGRLDLGFHPVIQGETTFQHSIAHVLVQADGKILIGGSFASVNGIPRAGLARLNPDGTLDLDFQPALEGDPFSLSRIAVQRDGKILIGGTFSAVDGVARNGFARLDPAGSPDIGFHPFASIVDEKVRVYQIATQPDEKILVCGRLTRTDGNYRHYFVRFQSDGTLDPGFEVNTSDEVEEFALQRDGKILIGGDFWSVDGVPRLGLARLDADGRLDAGFAPAGDFESVLALATDGSGKVLVGLSDDNPIGRFVQLDANGALDRDFNPNVNQSVSDIAIQADGKILIAGGFTSVHGQPMSYLARLYGRPENEVSLCCFDLLDGRPGFDIISATPRTIVVEASTNLVNWSALETLTVGSEAVRFSDSDAAAFAGRFYRVSWQP